MVEEHLVRLSWVNVPPYPQVTLDNFGFPVGGRLAVRRAVFRHRLPKVALFGPKSAVFSALDLQFLLYSLHFAPFREEKLCNSRYCWGGAHRPHLSQILCFNKTKYVGRIFCSSGNEKFKCLVALSGSQRPHKQNMCLQRPIWFSCGCQRNRHTHICGRVMVVIRTVDWTSSEKVLTGQVVRSLSRPCQGLTS